MSMRGAAGALVVGLLGQGGTEAAPLELRLTAEFQHGASPAAYTTRVNGVVDGDFTVAGPSAASLALLPREPGCFAIGAWRNDTPPPATSRPAVVCVTAPAVSDADLDAWLAGKGGADPRLVVPLVPTGSPGGWTTASTLVAALFIRGCGSGGFHRHGTLSASPGALGVLASTDPQGEEVIDVSATAITLDAVSQAAWDDVLAGCDGAAAGLPPAPTAGTSAFFGGTSSQPPDDPSQPHVQIAAVRHAVDDLVAAQRLAAPKAKSLTRRLDKAAVALRKGDARRTLQQLERFQRKVAAFAGKGTLAQADADVLVSGAVLASNTVLLLAAGPPLAVVDPAEHCSAPVASCPEDLCAFTTYHVDEDYAGILVSDGSAARPFRTIADALGRAAALDLCAVELLVASGVYAGDVDLSRHTRIDGAGARTRIAGSVTNLGAFELRLTDVLVAPPAGQGIVGDDPCARTTLTNVYVQDATGYGVRHRGGSLDARGLTVVGTRDEPDYVTRGTGVYLTCGVEAALDDVILDANDAAGLHAAGDGTVVEVTDLRVTRTGVHPALIDACSFGQGVGAVQVRDGARLTVSLFTITSNEGYGLYAGFDGQATLRDGLIATTSAVECADGRRQLGFNAATLEGGTADATSFTFTRPELAGVVLHENGTMDLHDGEVSHGPIGVSVQWDFDVARLQDGVRFIDNRTTLDATALPVPGVFGSAE